MAARASALGTSSMTPVPGAGVSDYEAFEGDPQGGGGQAGSQGAGEAGQDDDATGQPGEEGQGEGDAEPLDPEEDDEDPLAGFLPPRQQPQPPTRGENRFRNLANENAELRRRLREIEFRAPAAPVQAPPAQPVFETDEQFRARLSNMNPDDRVSAQLERYQRQSEWRDMQRQQQMAMQNDKTSFEAKTLADGRYARWAEKVEERHQQLLREGQFVPREVVFKFLLGEHLLSREGQKEATRQAKRGQQRVQRQTTRPTNAGSDVGGGRRQPSDREARARRLENLQI